MEGARADPSPQSTAVKPRPLFIHQKNGTRVMSLVLEDEVISWVNQKVSIEGSLTLAPGASLQLIGFPVLLEVF